MSHRVIPQASLFLWVLIMACSAEANDFVCTVGDLAYDAADLTRRAAVAETYYERRGEPYVALAQLIQGGLAMELLRQTGGPVEAAVIEGEARRIDTHTLAPQQLARIKAAYGADRAAYLRGFVAPVYARRLLYNAFLSRYHDDKGKVGIRDPSIERRPAVSNYDTWFWARAIRIPVWIADPDLRHALIKNVAWARNLHLIRTEPHPEDRL